MQHWPEPLTIEQARAWLRRAIEGYATPGYGRFAVELADGAYIGDAGILVAQIQGRTENDLGYIIAHSQWRLGYGLESARACFDYGHGQGLQRIVANMAHDNVGSIRVARAARLHTRDALSESAQSQQGNAAVRVERPRCDSLARTVGQRFAARASAMTTQACCSRSYRSRVNSRALRANCSACAASPSLQVHARQREPQLGAIGLDAYRAFENLNRFRQIAGRRRALCLVLQRERDRRRWWS